MKHALATLLAVCCLMTFTLSPTVFSQEKDRVVETKADVPALNKFHTVIYKLWHTAWPKKDYELMAKLLPDIEKHAANVASAELPGILRDKKGPWTENVKKLQAIVQEYKTAVEKKEDPKLLDAAERLHAQYEKLVRVIKPALKEVDDFHTVLYMLYHYYMPEYTIDSIRASASALIEKMATLNKAQLPERLKKKEATFTSARTALSESVDALATTVPSNDQDKIKASVERVHTNYLALEKVFD